MRTAFVKGLLVATALCVLAGAPARAEVRILASPGGQVGPFLDLLAADGNPATAGPDNG